MTCFLHRVLVLSILYAFFIRDYITISERDIIKLVLHFDLHLLLKLLIISQQEEITSEYFYRLDLEYKWNYLNLFLQVISLRIFNELFTSCTGCSIVKLKQKDLNNMFISALWKIYFLCLSPDGFRVVAYVYLAYLNKLYIQIDVYSNDLNGIFSLQLQLGPKNKLNKLILLIWVFRRILNII